MVIRKHVRASSSPNVNRLCRVGTGFDIHRFEPNNPSNRALLKLAPDDEMQGGEERRTGACSMICEDSSTAPTQQIASGVEFQKSSTIMLCGIAIPCDYSIVAHSDGDVALHALTDALLGAAAEGSIGICFPNTDPKWKNAASRQFVEHAVHLITSKGGSINNVDLTIIAETPRVAPHRQALVRSVADILGIPETCVNVKGTTAEGLGAIGAKQAIACQAVASILL
jgi:2-C-methyl-D-erythritol 4-phosphate cytidylyltransferase/2-C-methyl-D-erythritol 2,4-cyclodiphosphate synthase